MREIPLYAVAIGLASSLAVFDVGLRIIERRLFRRFDELLAREPEADAFTRLRFVAEDRVTLGLVRGIFAVLVIFQAALLAPSGWISLVATAAVLGAALAVARSVRWERRRLSLPAFRNADWVLFFSGYAWFAFAVFAWGAETSAFDRRWIDAAASLAFAGLALASVFAPTQLGDRRPSEFLDAACAATPDWVASRFDPIVVIDSARHVVQARPGATVVARALVDASSFEELRDLVAWQRQVRLTPLGILGSIVGLLMVLALPILGGEDAIRRPSPIVFWMFAFLSTRSAKQNPLDSVSPELARIGTRVVASELVDFPCRASPRRSDSRKPYESVVEVPRRSSAESGFLTFAILISATALVVALFGPIFLR